MRLQRSTSIVVAVVAMAALPVGSARAADPPRTNLKVCISNPNDAALHTYTVEIEDGPNAFLLEDVRTGIDGKVGCVTLDGGAARVVTILMRNLESSRKGKTVVNSRLTKIVVERAGKKVRHVTNKKFQATSGWFTTGTLPANQLTTLTYTARVLKPVDPR